MHAKLEDIACDFIALIIVASIVSVVAIFAAPCVRAISHYRLVNVDALAAEAASAESRGHRLVILPDRTIAELDPNVVDNPIYQALKAAADQMTNNPSAIIDQNGMTYQQIVPLELNDAR